MKNQKIYNGIFYYVILIYLEIIFRIFCTEKIFTITFIHTLLYLIPISFLLTLLTNLFKDKVNRILQWITIGLLTVWYAVLLVFKRKFGVFFSINSMGMADQLTSFFGDTIKAIIHNIPIIILMFLPLILMIIFHKHIAYNKSDKKRNLYLLLLIFISYLLFIGSIFIGKKDVYSVYNLYFKVENHALTVEKIGALPSTMIELRRKVLEIGRNLLNIEPELEDELFQNPEAQPIPKEEVYTYNALEIDFAALNNNTTDKTLITMNNYFSQESGTKKNKYTGMYQGKNLIVFMAESFNMVGVREDLTPTLYKLVNSSFVFENFYSPVILSTIGGEFQELTGLYPNLNLLSNVWRKGINEYPYGFGNVFNNLGYNTYAYHDNQYNFQARDKYLKSIGFNNYLGCWNGLEERINCNAWPESDIEMIETTVDDYITSEKPFMTYYATVSGHMPYQVGGRMYNKYKNLVKDLPYSDQNKAYLASQIELDRALEILINKLDAAGKLDDTVIALVGDHYPYDISADTLNELSTYERDSIVEINRSNFILWNNQTETTKITKVGSQIDVLPTLLNLFGVEYDSRLIIGKDILSESPGLAMFSNNSWVSDYGTYYASSGKFVPKDGVEVSDDYIANTNGIVQNKIAMSKYIIQENYYKYIYDSLQK